MVYLGYTPCLSMCMDMKKKSETKGTKNCKFKTSRIGIGDVIVKKAAYAPI